MRRDKSGLHSEIHKPQQQNRYDMPSMFVNGWSERGVAADVYALTQCVDIETEQYWDFFFNFLDS